MSMDLPPKTTELAAAKPRRKHSRALLFAIAVAIMLITTVITLLLSGPGDEQMTWLTPAQMSQAKQVGPFIRLKYQLKSWIGPFARFFVNRKKSLIQLNSNIFRLSTASADQIDLGAPTSTNADGMRAWILSSKDLSSFQQHLKAVPDATLMNSPRMLTSDGISSQ